jgi:hypothetical protein
MERAPVPLGPAQGSERSSELRRRDVEPLLPVLDRIGSLLSLVGGDVAAVLYASTGKKVGQRPGELGPEDILKRRTGYMVADASTVYEASFRRDDLIECGCNTCTSDATSWRRSMQAINEQHCRSRPSR